MQSKRQLKQQQAKKVSAVVIMLCVAIGLSGCNSLLTEGSASAAGVGGAALATAVTNNAAVATGIGLGVQAGARAGLQYYQRQIHGQEQDTIAQLAGDLQVGGVTNWEFTPSMPIEDAGKGRVTVSRLISTQTMNCKEIIFSVDTVENNQPHSAFYIANICRDGKQWKWASAEPATERWGALQ
ncbi:hypothetical protein [Glaciimonas soli]|uniref:Lipoprotein n=1 Tax=Glaciimonas soli TaxID=2590999 RepID=A0A843YWY6_9BURK|nr:hypothetical protein [Glaciimonas soli]MQR01732.1 hypothetical protein [Glaciimonas soli]